MSTAALRYWETVRHLRVSQVAARLKLRGAAVARRRWPAATERRYLTLARSAQLRGRQDGLGDRVVEDILALRGASDDRELSAAAEGRFCFLNQTHDLGWPVDWSAKSATQLWRYHLHYFDLLPYHSRRGDDIVPLVEDWIRSNPLHGNGATRDAWHPYVVSLRLVNWLLAFSRQPSQLAPSDDIRSSLVCHALFIERNCETDVGGNHLLKNLKAMAFAGCCWEGPLADRWRLRFTDAFTRELSRQVLADGGHYERSPMYHCQVMTDAVEVATVMAGCGQDCTALVGLIDRMDAFLRLVTHPDGDIALFNDSAFEMTPRPARLHRAVERLRSQLGKGDGSTIRVSMSDAAVASGYVALPAGDPSSYLLADVGRVCPDDLPAHAHSDLLSFELSIGGRRFIVNSGVGAYQRGEWRDYYRSTRAHNTVAVDDAEQSDCWSSFRVGRRAYPIGVKYAMAQDVITLEAAHSGFEHLEGRVRHRRQFAWSPSRRQWSVNDSLSGAGTHKYASYCHLHPAVTIVAEHSDWLRLSREDQVLDIHWHGFSSAALVTAQRDPLQGWYADRFGDAVSATVLVLTGRGPLPVQCGYDLLPRTDINAPPPTRL